MATRAQPRHPMTGKFQPKHAGAKTPAKGKVKPKPAFLKKLGK